MVIWYSKLLPKYWTANLEDLVCNLTSSDAQSPFIVLTPNLNHLRVVEESPQGRQAYIYSDLLTADGMPIHWINKFAFKRITPRISGIDLTAAVIASGKSFSVIGSSKEAVCRACIRLGRSSEGVNVFDDYFEFNNVEQDSQAILDFLTNNTSRIVFIALDAEKQLVIMRMVRERLTSCVVVIGVGGSFDVLSGLYLRAPLVLQRFGLEWFWRAIQKPKTLFPRYGSDLLYLLRFVMSICAMKRFSKGPYDTE
jgi:N-acetylglucosaminyldiphosphoundecaprenol N-acetyl-beta-D-mannosaminyltransferase